MRHKQINTPYIHTQHENYQEKDLQLFLEHNTQTTQNKYPN